MVDLSNDKSIKNLPIKEDENLIKQINELESNIKI